MFDLNDEIKTRVSEGQRIPTADMPEDDFEQPTHALDTPVAGELHTKLLGFYRQELDRQSENRYQMAIDEDFYDNVQYTEEDARVLKDRGQAPVVYNVICQTINWIIGSEKRSRTDYKILPREKEDAKPAQAKTKMFKYFSDVNRTQFHRSRAFEDAAKVGIGWLEDGAQDDDDGEILYSRYESWRNLLWDSSSTEMDMSDCRYVFRGKWVDEDIALALAPDRENVIHTSAVDGARFGVFSDDADGDDAMDAPEFERDSYAVSSAIVTSTRRRVKLIEGWFRKPITVQKMKGGNFRGEVYDPNNPEHQSEIDTGNAALINRVQMRMHVAIFTTAGLLFSSESPYKHNRFPFTPIFCYRRGRTGLPYGAIRGMRDIQEGINKRASKALYIMSTNKVVMDEGALPDEMDLEEFREEVSRPDGIIIKKRNHELELNVDRDLAPAHLEMMSRDINMIQQVGGVTDELLGRSTNATSGVAVQKRQEQGSLATAKIFDNYRLSMQLQGEIQLSLMEQYVSEQKSFRVTNERGVPDYITVNDGLPENNITRAKADFVISEADWRASVRQAQTDQLIDMLTKMPPEIALTMFDLVVDGMDVPNREEIVKRIRAVNGQRDPDQTEPTPEDQAKAQSQQEQDQFNKEMANAGLRKLNAEASESEARAALAKTNASKTMSDVINTNLNAHLTAVNAAREIVITPGVIPIADALMKESGWIDINPTQIPAPRQMAANGLPPFQQPPPQQQHAAPTLQ